MHHLLYYDMLVIIIYYLFPQKWIQIEIASDKFRDPILTTMESWTFAITPLESMHILYLKSCNSSQSSKHEKNIYSIWIGLNKRIYHVTRMQLSQNGFWLAEKEKKTRTNWIRAKNLQQRSGSPLELLGGPGVENRPSCNIRSLFVGP